MEVSEGLGLGGGVEWSGMEGDGGHCVKVREEYWWGRAEHVFTNKDVTYHLHPHYPRPRHGGKKMGDVEKKKKRGRDNRK